MLPLRVRIEVRNALKAIESVNKDFFIFKRDKGDNKLIDKGFNARGVLINAFGRVFFLWYRELTLNQENWIGYWMSNVSLEKATMP